MDINTIINVIAIILAIGNFVCLYSISQKKAYYEEKGKNLATKEDIGEITKEIKSVESQFINETEKLKNKLAILANAQTDITSMERQAIIEVNKSLFLWIDSVLNIPNVNSSNQIDNYINIQNQLYKNVQQDEIVLRLFVKSDNIHNICLLYTSPSPRD